MIANNGCRSHGIPDKHCLKHQAHIHEHPIGRYTVLPNVFQKLKIIEHIHKRHGNIVQKLRGPVSTDLYECSPIIFRPSETQETVIRPGKINQWEQTAHNLAECRSCGCTLQSPVKYCHKQCIQNNIGTPRRNGHGKPQRRFLCRDKQTLKFILKNISRNCQQNDTPIGHAVLKKLPLCPKQNRQRTKKHKPQNHQNNPADSRHIDNQRKQTPGLFLFSLTHSHGNQCTAASSEHKAHTAEHHQKRHNKINRRKGRFSHIIGYEKSVHHAVDGGKNQSNHGRQRKPQ